MDDKYKTKTKRRLQKNSIESMSSSWGETACREWSRTILNGYGKTNTSFGGVVQTWQAHRLAWTLKHGDIPDGMNVCHQCDNPRCINTDHMFLGTPADNSLDKLIKNRHMTKLEWSEVCEIRILAPTTSYSVLAEMYGVCVNTIGKIANYHTRIVN